MNIWYLCKYVTRPEHGNVGMRAYFLMEELSKKNWNIDILTSTSNSFLNKNNKNIETINESFTFHQLNGMQYGDGKAFMRILSWLEYELKVFFYKKKKLRKPDVIIVSSLSILTIINGLIWSKYYKAKLVFEVRDIWPLTLTEEWGFSKYNPFIVFLSMLERWAYLSSDLIIGTMPNLSSHVENITNNSSLNIKCIPFGYPDRESKYFRSDLPIKSNNKNLVIGYVGSIANTNALDTLFNAIHEINLSKHNLEFHIAGDGPLLESYKSEFSNIKNLQFLGRVNKEKVPELISKFDIVYLSTKNSEVWEYGQSLNKLVDYMLSGKPVLASYSGFQSMINEAECGWMIEAESVPALVSALNKIINLNSDKLESIGQNGREWILKNRKYSTLAEKLNAYLMDIDYK